MVNKITLEKLMTVLKIKDVTWLGKPIFLRVIWTNLAYLLLLHTSLHLLPKATERKTLNYKLMRLDFKVLPRSSW
jgi:hypothetical protein